MSSDHQPLAIRAQGLGKRYRIGEHAAYGALRDSLANAVIGPGRRLRSLLTRETHDDVRGPDSIWALRDVSFDVQRGEAVGIIGRNGAGKSTLLKLLSRITEPTEGRVEISGRLASLLEVGTGFHGELTGRENVYMNAAILGMRRHEIRARFDEIVEFSGVEKFIDTPVKLYSSGMAVRLAFAVAAHIEPEILIVDEVLAVGDAAFQKKCLEKMGHVAGEGRTVLFVSHNIPAVASICDRCLLLDEGALVAAGPVNDVVSTYQRSLYTIATRKANLTDVEHYGSGAARFTSIDLAFRGADGTPVPLMRPGGRLGARLRIAADAPVREANVALVIYDAAGYRVIDANTASAGSFLSLGAGQRAEVEFELLDLLLRPGTYLIGLWLGRGSIEDIDGVLYAISFSVEIDPEKTSHSETFPGVYQCRYEHTINIDGANAVSGTRPPEDSALPVRSDVGRTSSG